ncbi:uncharacterized protein LOC124927753 isoform X2 [Impatiens glandulifera]|uniref:uncharacterized protein LOC124927753 isoform X2 n=1 Tax=Impatiens glandulifera TaxID=253017 RepID=UPI001FB1811B|nr:uncharacterized protein LOC124927753 isoform X2 [Impatiens glandulifera]
MLSRGGFLSFQCPSAAAVFNTAPQNSNSCFLCHSVKIHGGHFSSILLQRQHFLSRDAFTHLRHDLSVSSSKSSNDVLLETEGFAGEDEWKDEDDEDDDDDEIDIPLMNMKNWLKNKPSGFGDGKVYDTSIEDKLFDEMEQSRQALLSNKNKLKSEASNPNAQKVPQKLKAKEEEPIQTGICVRLVNLPKKKNIHRDLQLAFKGVPGILNIVPANDGNKKTRDPICKGFAFVYLHSEAHAKKFVQLFSEQDISFGKIQKKITLEIIDPNSLKSNDTIEKLPVKGKSNDTIGKLPVKDKSYASQSSSSLKGDVSIDFESVVEDIPEEDLEAFDFSDVDDDDDEEEPKTTQKKTATISTPARKSQEPAKKGNPKKPMAKKKAQKQPQLNIPGSANRLKFREKAVLTGVYSKYGGQAASEK